MSECKVYEATPVSVYDFAATACLLATEVFSPSFRDFVIVPVESSSHGEAKVAKGAEDNNCSSEKNKCSQKALPLSI